MLSATSTARLQIRLASCVYSVPVPQLVNYRYTVVQLRNMQKYDVISIFQDCSRDRQIAVPVLYLLMSLLSEGQSLLAK